MANETMHDSLVNKGGSLCWTNDALHCLLIIAHRSKVISLAAKEARLCFSDPKELTIDVEKSSSL